MTRWIFNIGWALLLLLGVSAFLITSGQLNQATNPKVSSYDVSGASALADLLRLRGYQIVVDAHPEPKVGAGDVVVAFTVTDEDSDKAATAAKKAADPNDDSAPEPDPSLAAADFLHRQTEKGMATFWLPLPANFESGSLNADKPVDYKRIDGKVRQLSGVNSGVQDSSDSQVALASLKDEPFVTADKVGSGFDIVYADGIGLTNRYLAQADNAQFFLETLKAYAPKAKRVVFTEATFGQAQSPGLLETIGPWAEGAWYQILFLFMVVVWTLNRRFGLPSLVRKSQTGGRELVDAFTDTMIRAKATSMSLEAVLLEADLKLRRLLKLRREASEVERDAQLPPRLTTTLAEVRTAAVMKKVHPKEALRLVVSLEKQLQELSAQKQVVGQIDRSRRNKRI